jgi:hypothetical protein
MRKISISKTASRIKADSLWAELKNDPLHSARALLFPARSAAVMVKVQQLRTVKLMFLRWRR